ncbi:Cytochrome c1 heme lyase [Vanrija albida]|uniref:Holocytochrome c-type synthase n=1 Tax=Vanrija albida TaxID=181172 RepID=A0ABR3PSG9_9TREE
MRWFSSSETEAPAASTSASAPAPAPPAAAKALPPDHPPVPDGVDSCPVDESARSVWLQAGAAAHPLQPSGSSASPSPESSSSSSPLSQHRVVSSIPRGQGSTYSHNTDSPATPADGEEATGNWVYPSEQQFFNAMARKNHSPRVADMRTVVPIHNAVNERAWEQILAWEAGQGGDACPGGPRLSSFVGRPKDLSPKAWAKTLVGYTAPFDRHDWYVDRCGKQIRYVIDFYAGKPDPKQPQRMAFYLDVRPALDDWESVRTRLSGLWR